MQLFCTIKIARNSDAKVENDMQCLKYLLCVSVAKTAVADAGHEALNAGLPYPFFPAHAAV